MTCFHIDAQCWRTRMTRRSVGSRYSSISRGASTAGYTSSVKKVVIESAASRRVEPMLCTESAALVGWVMMKKMTNASTRNPTILLRFTRPPFRAGVQ